MIILFSKKNCPNCETLKAFLESSGVDFSVSLIDYDLEAKEFLLSEGHRSVPQVYNDGKFLGGYSDLMNVNISQLSLKGLLNAN